VGVKLPPQECSCLLRTPHCTCVSPELPACSTACHLPWNRYRAVHLGTCLAFLPPGSAIHKCHLFYHSGVSHILSTDFDVFLPATQCHSGVITGAFCTPARPFCHTILGLLGPTSPTWVGGCHHYLGVQGILPLWRALPTYLWVGLPFCSDAYPTWISIRSDFLGPMESTTTLKLPPPAPPGPATATTPLLLDAHHLGEPGGPLELPPTYLPFTCGVRWDTDTWEGWSVYLVCLRFLPLGFWSGVGDLLADVTEFNSPFAYTCILPY